MVRFFRERLIERDPGDYVELAVGVATDPAPRQHWRDALRRDKGAIFHDDRATSELRNAWSTMLGDV